MEPHAWNVLEIDGHTVLCDITWNNNDSDVPCTYSYFNLSLTQMSRDHWMDEMFSLPATTDALEYHRLSGHVV